MHGSPSMRLSSRSRSQHITPITMMDENFDTSDQKVIENFSQASVHMHMALKSSKKLFNETSCDIIGRSRKGWHVIYRYRGHVFPMTYMKRKDAVKFAEHKISAYSDPKINIISKCESNLNKIISVFESSDLVCYLNADDGKSLFHPNISLAIFRELNARGISLQRIYIIWCVSIEVLLKFKVISATTLSHQITGVLDKRALDGQTLKDQFVDQKEIKKASKWVSELIETEKHSANKAAAELLRDEALEKATRALKIKKKKEKKCRRKKKKSQVAEAAAASAAAAAASKREKKQQRKKKAAAAEADKAHAFVAAWRAKELIESFF